MIRVDIKPRQDDRYDIYVSDDNGNALLNSNQGYENVEDAEKVVRRLARNIAAADYATAELSGAAAHVADDEWPVGEVQG